MVTVAVWSYATATTSRGRNGKRIDATGERKRFASAILPPWCRKSLKISEVLPLLYLHGLSSGDFVPALEQFLGSSAGLSPATVTRLTTQWQADHTAFQDRDLSATDYVYVWADGVHLRIRHRRVRPGPVAGRERTPSRRSRPRRGPLRTRPTRRTTRDLRGITKSHRRRHKSGSQSSDCS